MSWRACACSSTSPGISGQETCSQAERPLASNAAVAIESTIATPATPRCRSEYQPDTVVSPCTNPVASADTDATWSSSPADEVRPDRTVLSVSISRVDARVRIRRGHVPDTSRGLRRHLRRKRAHVPDNLVHSELVLFGQHVTYMEPRMPVGMNEQPANDPAGRAGLPRWSHAASKQSNAEDEIKLFTATPAMIA